MTQLTSPITTPPTAPLAYAQGAGNAAALTIRPIALLLPNLLTLVVLFLPVSSNDAPIDPIAQCIRVHLFKQNVHSDIWEAFITGPFLLGIPLAIWTIRLCIRPANKRRESIVAWSMTLTALAMTLFAASYALYSSPKMHGFIVAAAAALLILTAGAIAVWSLRSLIGTYPTALLGMTSVYAADVTLTMLVVLTHGPWQSGSVLGVIVVVSQLIACGILFLRWRATLSL